MRNTLTVVVWIPMKILKVPHQVAVQEKALMKMNQMQAPSGSKKRKNDRQPRSTGEKQRKKNKKQNDSLNNNEMEELTTWIFSVKEAPQVEAEIRPQVAGSPRVKLFSGRERFAQHMLSEEQKASHSWILSQVFNPCE